MIQSSCRLKGILLVISSYNTNKLLVVLAITPNLNYSATNYHGTKTNKPTQSVNR